MYREKIGKQIRENIKCHVEQRLAEENAGACRVRRGAGRSYQVVREGLTYKVVCEQRSKGGGGDIPSIPIPPTLGWQRDFTSPVGSNWLVMRSRSLYTSLGHQSHPG